MVQGIGDLRARFNRVPELVRREVRDEIANQATQMVAQMQALNRARRIEINWTWGAAPAGALVIGEVRGQSRGKVQATIYAVGPPLEGARVPIQLSRVVEFGTGPRRQRTTGRSTGSMPASPFFWPVYRANKSRARGAISRAVNRAVKRA